MTEGIEIFVYKLDKIIDHLEKIAVPKSICRILIEKLFWLIVISLILFTFIFSIWIITNPGGKGPRYRYKDNNQIVWQRLFINADKKVCPWAHYHY